MQNLSLNFIMHVEKERENKIIVPASDTDVEAADYVVFFLGKTSMLDVRPQVIQPSQSAAFPTPPQPFNYQKKKRNVKNPSLNQINIDFLEVILCICTDFLWKGDPVSSGAGAFDVGFELRVLLRRPRPLLHVSFVTAWSSSHGECVLEFFLFFIF